jgi:excisionase family DNA binding protein
MSSPGQSKLFTTGQIAKYCQVSVPTVFNWIKASKLKAYTTAGGQYRVRDVDLLEFMRGHGMYIPPELDQMLCRRILLADDEKSVRRAVSNALRKIPGVEVDTASDGFETCLKVGQAKPDLLVIDIDMPAMDGWQVCRSLAETGQLEGVKVLVISGVWSPEDEDPGIPGLKFEYLAKPFETKRLTACVQQLLGT